MRSGILIRVSLPTCAGAPRPPRVAWSGAPLAVVAMLLACEESTTRAKAPVRATSRAVRHVRVEAFAMAQLYSCTGRVTADGRGMVLECKLEDYGQGARVVIQDGRLLLSVQERRPGPPPEPEAIPLPCGAHVRFFPISPCNGFPCIDPSTMVPVAPAARQPPTSPTRATALMGRSPPRRSSRASRPCAAGWRAKARRRSSSRATRRRP